MKRGRGVAPELGGRGGCLCSLDFWLLVEAENEGLGPAGWLRGSASTYEPGGHGSDAQPRHLLQWGCGVGGG